MSSPPHCPSTEALNVLLPRARLVVAATHLGSGFPKAVAELCRSITVDILWVTVDATSLSNIVGQDVSFNDVAVFADGALVAYVPQTGLDPGQAIASLLMMFIDQKAAQNKARDDEATHLALVRAAIEQGAAWVNAKDQKKKPVSKSASRRDPHVVLGVRPGASQQELKRARDHLLTIAHSDRVDNLHPALRELATQLTCEILEAYKSLSKPPRPQVARAPG
jgi:DnaJ-domain-containing protein 1